MIARRFCGPVISLLYQWRAAQLLQLRTLSSVSQMINTRLEDEAWADLESQMNLIRTFEKEVVVDTSLGECKRRDEVIRPFYTHCFWSEFRPVSFKLAQRLFIEPFPEGWKPYNSAYPYVFDFYWEVLPGVSHFTGDLLFTDGLNRFLVVETQLLETGLTHQEIRSRRRNARRRHGRQKLVHGMHIWHFSQPQVVLTEGLWVTEEGVKAAEPLHRQHVNECLADINLFSYTSMSS